jgi:large subunit ribosomal protein L17
MHRHGYKGRKLHRELGPRRALIKSLADSLIKYESIETTLPKAKEVTPYVEKLITKAKKGDLHNRRQIIAKLQTLESAHKLVDDLVPKLKGRTSGHLRIEKTGFRRGDNAPLARVSFVDDLKAAPVAKPAEPVTSKPKPTAAKSPAKSKTMPKTVAKKTVAKAASAKEKAK